MIFFSQQGIWVSTADIGLAFAMVGQPLLMLLERGAHTSEDGLRDG